MIHYIVNLSCKLDNYKKTTAHNSLPLYIPAYYIKLESIEDKKWNILLDTRIEVSSPKHQWNIFDNLAKCSVYTEHFLFFMTN